LVKQVTSALLLLVFLLQTFSRTAIVVDFYANQSYIAKNLCENRDKPKMKCCGKCQLSKRLKQEDKKDQENPDRKIDTRFEIIQQETDFYSYQLVFTEQAEHSFTTYYQAHYPKGMPAAPFRPPCV
jgi:hypothetical protein